MTKYKLSLAAGAAGLILSLAVGLHALYSEPEAPPPDPRCRQLLPEFCDRVKDAFNLARNLYVQGKYELCLTEVAKVHDVIPQYENSRELQTFCEQGRELVKRQRDLEAKERAAREEANEHIEAARQPASAGTYTCKHLTLSHDGFENYLNETCDREKPFAITPLGDSRNDYHVCCIAKKQKAKSRR